MIKTESAKDLSVWLIHTQNASYVLYVVYGIGREDLIYIVSSSLSVLQNIFILYLRRLYINRIEKRNRHTEVEFGRITVVAI